MSRTVLAMSMTMGLLLSGCGSDHPGTAPNDNGEVPSCAEITSTFTDCGGDPTGRWVPEATCAPTSFAQLFSSAAPECQGMAITAVVTPATGQVVYGSQPANTLAYTMTTSAHITQACLVATSPLAAMAPMSTVCPMIPTQTHMSGLTCAAGGDGCDCTLVAPMTAADSAADTYATCLQENVLTLQSNETGVIVRLHPAP